MKREFKAGDRVLVRDTDLQDWQVKTFRCIHSGGTPSYPFIDTGACSWTQCRHIDDFRTGDKVQVRNSMAEEWEDAVYGCYVPHDSFEHWVYSENEDDLTCHKLCRWHPSMPWAEKEEPLTLEQRVEALERKLNKTFNTKEK